ncbi:MULTISPECIES: TadE/TadG family type IV pilus assembly protein [unclassified Frankia]|uniref:TadE/TadG family type IV pilus assembly protein n=1 Tax=unclassified Frankia TaxID=2632575 RepID=UPI002AD1F419|nr:MULTISPECIES: TadE/TadG family type IV pilus assembly protein [unclassified Frankia]
MLARPAGDRGSAIVEFVLVGMLLLLLFLGVVQVGLVLHIRNTLAADAAEGARHAANLNMTDDAGGPYAERLIASSVPGRADTRCTSAAVTDPSGVPLVEVRCEVTVPLTFVPFGASTTIRVVGHAVKETP